MDQVSHMAEFSGFLRTVLTILIVIYALRFLGKLLAPWMMRKAQSKIQNMAEDQMRKQGFDMNGKQQQRPEGSITVENVKSKKSNSTTKTSSDDDYVDFVEVSE